ncbi:hypothetical protein PR202_ga18541 [Eleusine coracana subsp. coracana]|uniref:Uncharacterized protein n=1 Tax=Eleusine coracana subsp. coracana TaxID=191504 RepID=A0AAV5CTT1_ELECO|nr:hypothetical protein PR202_ga18541 [Eleusine coracana subsp. coracana]
MLSGSIALDNMSLLLLARAARMLVCSVSDEEFLSMMFYDFKEDPSPAGVSDEEFLSMMFYDACFLLQFMRSMAPAEANPSFHALWSFFDSKVEEIFHDIMLLEKQLPWLVLETVMRFVPVNLVQIISFLKVGKRYETDKDDDILLSTPSSTASIRELAEIGITITPNKTNDLKDMGVHKTGLLFAKLCLPPLLLDVTRPSLLINMAAHELCIENYRSRRPMRTKVHAFLYNNGKAIATLFSVIAALVSILKAFQPLTMLS